MCRKLKQYFHLSAQAHHGRPYLEKMNRHHVQDVGSEFQIRCHWGIRCNTNTHDYNFVYN